VEDTSSEKIAEALKLLESAAKHKKDEVLSLISDKYTHLRSVIGETESSLGQALSDARKHAIVAALHARDISIEKARELADDVDQHVHRNPWPYIGGAAAVGLLLGYILGRRRA
jgi:ElaB/YqjD/DUF883 family membrane-anchored ribosome-binding protein